MTLPDSPNDPDFIDVDKAVAMLTECGWDAHVGDHSVLATRDGHRITLHIHPGRFVDSRPIILHFS